LQVFEQEEKLLLMISDSSNKTEEDIGVIDHDENNLSL